jgi:hypothetical protein
VLRPPAELARRFFAAVQEGETEPLVELLAADVAFYGDGGGKAPAIGKPMFGAERVADLLLGFARVALRQGRGWSRSRSTASRERWRSTPTARSSA